MAADDNNWTWVLERPCDQCGVDAQATNRDDLAARVRTVGGSWRQMLGRSGVVNREPAGPSRTWTILEYGCHVSDVFELLEERLRLILKKRKPPTLAYWNPNDAAVAGNYAEADADKVAYALATRAGKVADVLDRVNGDEWQRTGVRSDGYEFSVESLTRYLLHDAEHHLWDAREIIDGN